MSEPQIESVARLEVERGLLVEELKRMVKVLGRRLGGEAVLSFHDGSLLFRLAGVEFAIPAKGRWPGEARMASSWLRALAKVPPAQDPVVIQLRGGRLHIASSSSPCHWQTRGAARIEIPLGTDLLELIRLGLLHPDEELEKSGLTRVVAKARVDLDKRIKAAARQLAPLGVTETDVRLLVMGKFKFDDRARDH